MITECPVLAQRTKLLTWRCLAGLSPERQQEVTESFCKAIGFGVDTVPDYLGAPVAYVIRDKIAGNLLGLVNLYNRRTGPVPARLVTSLWDSMCSNGVENGIIFSNQPFSDEALEQSLGKNIELMDPHKLYEDILLLSEEAIEAIEEQVFQIRFTAPMCPRCGGLMDQAENGIGTYWKCSRYPICRQTLMY